MGDKLLNLIDQLADGLVDTINVIADSIGVAVNWTTENVVPYLSDLINRFIGVELWTSVVILIFLLLIIIPSIIVLIIQNKRYKKAINNQYNQLYKKRLIIDSSRILSIFTVFVIVISLLLMIPKVLNIVTCVFIPEKVILEEIDYYSQYFDFE